MTPDELRSWSDRVLTTSPRLWSPGLPDVAQAVRELLKERDAVWEQCAKIADEMADSWNRRLDCSGDVSDAADVARAIRATAPEGGA